MCSLILFVAAGSFILPKIVWADEKDLIITEIMYDPSCKKEEKCSDWFEIYNKSSDKLTISNKEIGIIDEENLDSSCHQIKSGITVESKGFAIIADNRDYFLKKYSDVDEDIVFDSSFDLSEKGDYIRLSSDNKCNNFFIDISYESSWGGKNNGKTLEKIDHSGNYSKNNWQESYILGGTPGEKNSEKPKPKEYPGKIRINEVLPDPEKNKGEEFIEIFNYNEEKVDLEGWILRDGSKTGKYIFPKDSLIGANDYLIIYKKDFKFALNNSGNENVMFLNPDEKVADEISYSGSKDSASYNYSADGWRWSKFLTPGEDNKFNNLPTSKLKIEKKIYKNMLTEFRVSAKDKDKDKLKFVWDFGDGHKSYLKNTKHKYEKSGTYKVSLKISDGSEDVFKTFEVKAGKFPKSELKITGVKANPKGKDTNLETIKIKNNSKKKINLKNWSVATGWKNLYNHPINKKIILKPGETKEITRKYSLFALNNKQAKIELRRPDGSVASKVKYSKKEGIRDDETYEKTEDGWEWIGLQSDAEETQANAENETEADFNINKTENIQSDASSSEENLADQKTISPEIQSDEPVGNGEVLGAEINRVIKTIPSSRPESENIFIRIIWSVNQKVSSFMNFLIARRFKIF